MDKTKFWDSFADEYAKNVLKNRKQIEERTNWLVGKFDLSGRSVLEIGPGPGTYTVPLSKFAKHITVIEQSSSMIEILRERLKKNSISNVSIIHGDWEDVRNLKRYYLVFSAFSLIVKDVRESLRKMDAVSCGYCCIFTFGNEPPWRRVHNRISKLLLGKEGWQGHRHIYGSLLDLRINPKLIMDERPYTQRFNTIDEAIRNYLKRFRGVKISEEDLDEVKRIISEEFRKTDDGYELSGKTTDALIWWKAEP